MGKSTINGPFYNSYVCLPEGKKKETICVFHQEPPGSSAIRTDVRIAHVDEHIWWYDRANRENRTIQRQMITGGSCSEWAIQNLGGLNVQDMSTITGHLKKKYLRRIPCFGVVEAVAVSRLLLGVLRLRSACCGCVSIPSQHRVHSAGTMKSWCPILVHP